jgi:hypothetical protein
MSAPFVRHLLGAAPVPDGRRRKSTSNTGPRNKHLSKSKVSSNLDLAVLKNLNQTHVTLRIADLAQGLVRENLVVVGARAPSRNKDLLQLEKKKAYDYLCRLIAKAKKEIKDVDYKKEDRVSVHSEFYKAVEVEKEIYRVCMIFPYFLDIVIYIFGIYPFLNRSETSFLFLMTPKPVGNILSSKDPKYAFLLMPRLMTFSGDLFTLLRIRNIVNI